MKRCMFIAVVLAILLIPGIAVADDRGSTDGEAIEIMGGGYSDTFIPDPELEQFIALKGELAEKYYNAKVAKSPQAAVYLNQLNILSDYAVNEPSLSNAIERFTEEVDTLQFESQDLNDTYEELLLRASSYTIGLTQVPQATSYYCGYAGIKSILDYWGINRSQSSIANSVYDTDESCPWYVTDGTSYSQYVAAVYLTDQTDFPFMPYPYGSMSEERDPITESTLKPRIVATVDGDYGVMVCGRSKGSGTSHLPDYPTNRTIYHWIVIGGYTSYGDDMYVVDPAYAGTGVSFAYDIEPYYLITIDKTVAYTDRGIIW